MLAWLALLALVIAEVVVLWWWLKREYYPVMFNPWAALLYAATFAVDVLAVWLLSMLFVPGGNSGLVTLLIVSSIVLLLVALSTLFFRWVIRQDLPDMQE